MRLSSFLVRVLSVSFAAALTPYSSDCGYAQNVMFNATRLSSNGTDATANGTDTDIFVRCAETTYACNRTLHDGKSLFLINSTNETVPADCEKEIYSLQPAWFDGPVAMPGLTQLSSISIVPYFHHGHRNITSLELPDLVNITEFAIDIEDAFSISNFSVPKLRHIETYLQLNFTGGPAIDLSFPSLLNVGDGIYISGNIGALDFPILNQSNFQTVYEGIGRISNYSIHVDSSGDLDCSAFAATVVNSTSYKTDGVSCTSKKGSVTLKAPEPPLPEVTSAAFRIQGGGVLALMALLACMMAL
ncbi:hypothetical protein V492_02660 [Pseudogymnoascus sp. VKM F-4246]|nr:hypothetical protein V492_02660 [Pseudogymnoascus sp. VKM F-4246]